MEIGKKKKYTSDVRRNKNNKHISDIEFEGRVT